MASTPNGTVIDVITEEGEDGSPPPKGSKKGDREEHATSPPPRGFHSERDQTGGVYSCGGYNPDFLGPPTP